MIDLKIVQEKYASMANEQLIYFARNDSYDLTSEAMDLLKQEFVKRGLNIADFPPEKNALHPEDENEDIPVAFDPVHGLAGGLPYGQTIPSPENNGNISSPGIEEELQRLIKKCDTALVINGLIFIAGSAVTLFTFMEGGGVIVAWGAILFGGAAFVRSFMAKKQCQAALKEVVAKKERSPENASL